MEDIDTSSVERFLAPYLPHKKSSHGVFVTATWAQSLDARIAAAPGERTQLSGMYTKKMTHYLRTKHDAILVGRNTVIADDPSLNSRYSANSPSPRPIILDAGFSWPAAGKEWKVLANARGGKYQGPWVVVDREVDAAKVELVRELGGDVIRVADTRDWPLVCAALKQRGVRSLMVEGGAAVLDSVLRSGVVSSIVITLAPVFLGSQGTEVSPLHEIRPKEQRWWSEEGVPDAILGALM